MPQKFANGARVELDTSITAESTELTVISGGDLFPVANYAGTGTLTQMSPENWFKLVIQDAFGYEVVYCYSHDAGSNTFSNLRRGQESTIAKSFGTQAVVGLRPLGKDLGDLVSQSKANADAIATKADKTGDIDGNSGSATKLESARALSISGGVTASAKMFDGSAPVDLEVTGIDVSKANQGILAVNRGGTGTSTSTGSGSNVLSESPEFTGIPKGPTASFGTNSSQLATTEFVNMEVSSLINPLTERVDAAILFYSSYIDASAAAATLPDGQRVKVIENGVFYEVLSGALIDRPNFWDDDPGGAQIWRYKGRSFWNGATVNKGNRGAPLGESWLTKYGANYFEKNSYNIMLSEEDRGKCPLLVGCYTGPSKTVSNYNMGFGAVSVNRGQGTMGRAGYFEAMHFSETGATACLELQVGNYTGTSQVANPYSPVGNADGISIGAESGHLYTTGDANTPVPPPTLPAGAAMKVGGGSIQASYQRFRSGIIFTTNSLYRGTDGVNGTAIAMWMAGGHEIRWAASSGIQGAKIRSDVTAVANRDVGIIFKDAAVNVTGPSEAPITTFTHDLLGAGGVNYLDIKNGRVNTYPVISAVGADANIGITLQSKGTAPIRFMTRGGTSEELRIQSTAANAVNFVAINGQATNAAPRVTALGADANIDLELSGKGTGVIKFGYASTAATTPASFTADRCIPIKDASGTTYYIPVRSTPW